MKHARADYQRIQDPAGLIPMDEPVFLLRGKDEAAPAAIEAWAAKATELGAAPAMVDTALKHADAMREWQADRGSQVPDMDDRTPPKAHGLSLCCQGISALQARISAPSMDDLQKYITKATVVIEPGQPNKMVLECLAGVVLAEAATIEVVDEATADLDKLAEVLAQVPENDAQAQAAEQDIDAIMGRLRHVLTFAKQQLMLNAKGLTRTELEQALHEITQHRCITMLPAEAGEVEVVKEGDMRSPVLAGVWRAEQTPTYARWWKEATHPEWLTQPGQHGLPQKFTNVEPLNDEARQVVDQEGQQ